MIYTVTFNPALDYVLRAKQVKFGETNRSQSEAISFGGKGINVSVVLHRLGAETKALGFTAGFTGAALEQSLAEQGIETGFVRLPSGLTRINVKLKTDTETEINAQGPEIPPEALETLFVRLRALRDGDTLVLAGSIPASLPQDIYEKILAMLSDRAICSVVDATGELLLRVLPYCPFLIKPNRQELSELIGRALPDEAALTEAARELQRRGARNVLVSLGGDGALLAAENGAFFRAQAAKGIMRNTVGAGDSMVAGFLCGWQQRHDYEYALRCGIAAGGATAFSEGLAEREEFLRLLAQSEQPQ